MSIKNNTWAWIYGDECNFLWEHFNMTNRNPDDRMKIKFIKYETESELPKQEEKQVKTCGWRKIT